MSTRISYTNQSSRNSNLTIPSYIFNILTVYVGGDTKKARAVVRDTARTLISAGSAGNCLSQSVASAIVVGLLCGLEEQAHSLKAERDHLQEVILGAASVLLA